MPRELWFPILFYGIWPWKVTHNRRFPLYWPLLSRWQYGGKEWNLRLTADSYSRSHRTVPNTIPRLDEGLSCLCRLNPPPTWTKLLHTLTAPPRAAADYHTPHLGRLNPVWTPLRVALLFYRSMLIELCKDYRESPSSRLHCSVWLVSVLVSRKILCTTRHLLILLNPLVNA
jgi:hypothetical protein